MSYSKDARQLALKVYHNSGLSLEATAKMLEISKTTLHEWVKREQRQESLEDRPRPGRPRVLTEEHRARLLELTQLYPDWTQEQYAQKLQDEFQHLTVSQPIISMEFQRHQITLKKSNGEQTKNTPQESNS